MVPRFLLLLFPGQPYCRGSSGQQSPESLGPQLLNPVVSWCLDQLNAFGPQHHGSWDPWLLDSLILWLLGPLVQWSLSFFATQMTCALGCSVPYVLGSILVGILSSLDPWFYGPWVSKSCSSRATLLTKVLGFTVPWISGLLDALGPWFF